MRKINKIVVHCSDSPQGRGDTAATIHRWHKANNWSGIGYHAVILEDGTIEYGRPDYWRGAHARGANKNSLGVCLIGRNSFTAKQMTALAKYVAEKRKKHSIKLENVIGHYEVPKSGKTCPNFDMVDFRSTL